MSNSTNRPKIRPPPLPLLRRIFDHQRWLASDGRFGRRFETSLEAEFVNCDIEGVDFTRAELSHAYFQDGSAKGAKFVEACLYEATFEACDVEGADFTKANLEGATLSTNHREARFDGANLTDTSWGPAEGERTADKRIRARHQRRLTP